jgi:hypothetical protein
MAGRSCEAFLTTYSVSSFNILLGIAWAQNRLRVRLPPLSISWGLGPTTAFMPKHGDGVIEGLLTVEIIDFFGY